MTIDPAALTQFLLGQSDTAPNGADPPAPAAAAAVRAALVRM